MESQGLYGNYDDPQDLAEQVIQALEDDIDTENWKKGSPIVQSTSVPGAILQWRHDHRKEQKGIDKRGKMQYRTLANRLVVKNTGDLAAENISFTVKGLDGTDFRFDGPNEPVTVEKDSERAWSLVPFRHGTVQIEASWSEGGSAKKQYLDHTNHVDMSNPLGFVSVVISFP